MLLMISLNQTLHPDFWMFEAHSNDLLKDSYQPCNAAQCLQKCKIYVCLKFTCCKTKLLQNIEISRGAVFKQLLKITYEHVQ